MDKKVREYYWWRTIASFLLVLFAMPLGHALMILMEKFMNEGAMHVAGFAMGFVGLILVIIGVFVKGDTRQTLWGLFGGLLFWTGWVEFLFLYYARRYGVPPEIENGVVVTKPEYLIMPASFGLWMMVMTMYVFSTKNGCDLITWIQKVCFRSKRKVVVVQPMTRHTSIVTFMELNMMLWGLYLLLMFCYDKRIVFWTPVEILGRINFFKEFWVEPEKYRLQMIAILAVFIVLGFYLWIKSKLHRRTKAND